MRAKTIAIATARILLGLVFVVCGLDGFLQYLPQPTSPPAAHTPIASRATTATT